MLSDNVLKNIKFLIICLLILITIFLSVYKIITSQFENVIKVSIDNQIVGYFKSESEFDNDFLQLKKELSAGYEICNIYLDKEPVFEKTYVKKEKLELQNNYTQLRSFIKTEYTTYAIYINNDKSMIFTDYTSANKYYNEIKNNTVNVAIQIKEEKDKEKIDITNNDKVELVKDKIISRYQPIIIPKVEIAIPKTAYPTISRYISCPYMGYPGHTGIDIAGRLNDNIYAYSNGKVIISGWLTDYGNCIVIDHGNGIKTRYAHLNQLLVNVGKYVSAGQTIGKMGTTGNSTGVHLHFEYIINDKTVNPYKYIF